jgi:hypothetical protein
MGRRNIRLSQAACLAAVLAGALAALTGCATARGDLYSDVRKSDTAASERLAPREEKPVVEKPASGVRIVTSPSGATVTLGLEVVGLTPIVLEDLKPGNYRLALSKEGYRTVAVWLDYDGSPLVYVATLEELTGYVQVATEPPEAQVLVGAQLMPSEGFKMRVGAHDLTVRAFGYEERTLRIEVREDSLTSLKVALRPAPFAFAWLDATRTTINPRNFGNLGTTRISFRVTAPGSAELRIVDAAGGVVFEKSFPSLATWDHEVGWDGRDPTTGQVLPEGTYRVEIAGSAADGTAAPSRTLSVAIDTSAVIVFRSLVSGSAGLVYAPSPDVLPRGSAQVSALALAHADAATGTATYRIPAALGVRVGLGSAEIDAEAGTYLSSGTVPGVVPLFGSISARYVYARPSGPIGLEGAAGARLGYHALSADTLTDFSGFSLSAPTRLKLAQVSLILTPEVTASWTAVSYGAAEPYGFRLWGYLRAGLLLDAGPVMLGISTALRLRPFSEGLGLDLPVPLAVEAHLTIPGTQIVLSAAAAAEVSGASDYYVMAGGGFGFLH